VTASLSSYPATPAAVLAKLAETTATGQGGPDTDADTRNLLALFFAATAEERRLILLNLDVAVAAPARLPAPVFGEVVRRLENAALQRNVGEFSRTLERALGISRDLAERVVRDPSGEPIVVAAKVLGMSAAVLQRILLFINPAVGQSVQRVFDLALLFDELSRQGAECMLAIWRKAGGSGKPSRTVHEPVHQADEARNARSAASPEPHRGAPDGNRDQGSERFKSTP
jgi:hypothetical protein